MTATLADTTVAPEQATAHLTPERWAAANRHLIRKALAEFSHERILAPEPADTESPAGSPAASPSGSAATDPLQYRLVSDDGAAEYRFTARRLELDHWSIPAEDIRRFAGGTETGLDALVFITEFSATLGINEQMLPVYLEEISSTLASHAFKNSLGAPSSSVTGRSVSSGVIVVSCSTPSRR